ncbi:unnamed protein product [Rhizopus stolonifer]
MATLNKENIKPENIKTKARIESILQRVTHACDHYKEKADNQLMQLSPEIRQETIEDFSINHPSVFESLLEHQQLKKLSEFGFETMESSLEEEEEDNDDENFIDNEILVGVKRTHQEYTNELGPLFILLEREGRPNVSIKLDPNRSVSELGNYKLVAPDNIMWQLNDDTHKRYLHEQVKDIITQLGAFQKHLEKNDNQ